MSKIRRSASVCLARARDQDDVYMVLRHGDHRAFPGTYVFPGGKVDPQDDDVEVVAGDPEVPTEEYVAAARELFEETGVLVARPRHGALDPAALRPHREALLAGQRDITDVLEALGADIDGELLVPLGVKTTPPFHPMRFRNRFFMALLPPGQEPEVIPGELERGDWFTPTEAVQRWEAAGIQIAPPMLMMLERWGARSAAEALPDLRGFDDATFAGVPLRIRFSPEVILFPGRTPTLPPATHTNTLLVGADRLLVVDPATDDPEDQRKLRVLLDQLAAEGRQVEAVVLTHHHVDHVGAVGDVVAHTGAPVWAHGETAARLPDVEVARLLEDGEVLDLGAGGEVEVLHTPGHAPGHVCLHQRKFDALIAGDMVSTSSTILVEPHDGDLGLYLASLERLKAVGSRILYPSHGDPSPNPRKTLEYFLRHRKMRLEKSFDALDQAPRDLDALLPVVYDDKPQEIWPLARGSLEACLLHLEATGRAARREGGWVATR